jgi:hypothetical protein
MISPHGGRKQYDLITEFVLKIGGMFCFWAYVAAIIG